MAFVPVGDVHEMFGFLLASDFVRENIEVLTKFIDYFEGTWIGRERHPPIMKHKWWNYAVAMSSMRRTSNDIEGWHSAFAGRSGAQHPSFSKLVKCLKVQQGKTEFIVSNSQAQGRINSRKKIYRDRTKRLKEVVESYEKRDPLKYLITIAHSIRF
ncbi:uncharacterized protein LOC108864722 [Galendromus occidentalis]|uniref:Uncharacterized protein LOC108864722 n=1 Tax=Galendromus occidentalis TaxID=34638 RepID=A0AAJ7L5G7_9ACAR|nr:uncharacterized protein LOC108864722 [Galendromus occidentalis]